MSKISLSPSASGTGTFTIASPATNTDRTLTLPDATGTINTSGAVNEVPAGTASAPSIYPTGDTNTGIFFPAADTVAFAEGGTESMRINSSGNVGIGTSSPNAALDVRTGTNPTILVKTTGTGFAAVNIDSSSTATQGYLFFNINGTEVARLTSNSSNYLAISTGSSATERMRIDSSGNLLFNSGYGSVVTAYGCRAWVNFNGTGTISIRASGNVTSLTDNGTGDYTINFTTAMPDANYSAVGMAGSTAAAESGTMICVSTTKNTSQATGSVRVATRYSDANATDVSNIGIAIFR